ncbi:unnamed protein product [Spirodela intermedia]|uniref:Uncharacterized protein n=2 Tax=Spirodela intermedia TaxID=51605 RepID=A0A7I8L8E2_SPIIN|nr:unnamed protein product [Spirodela intermedia]CAA6669082.1 unnamed protein product [Spirodela intermedia]CAA7406032.1 unnamed protein product [Spirodela intermedia]
MLKYGGMTWWIAIEEPHFETRLHLDLIF